MRQKDLQPARNSLNKQQGWFNYAANWKDY